MKSPLRNFFSKIFHALKIPIIFALLAYIILFFFYWVLSIFSLPNQYYNDLLQAILNNVGMIIPIILLTWSIIIFFNRFLVGLIRFKLPLLDTRHEIKFNNSITLINVFIANSIFLLFLPTLFPSNNITDFLIEFLQFTLVINFTLIIINAIDIIFYALINKHATAESEENAAKIISSLYTTKKIFVALVIAIAIGIVFMTSERVKNIGQSILASAGIAGIIMTIIARESFSSFFSSMQIMINKSVKLNDMVFFENELGTVEDISLTHITIKLWDLRRLIVPVSYFSQKPFQNWTITSSNKIGTIFLYVDFFFPVEKLREKLKDFITDSPLWDSNILNLQVTSFDKEAMELRILVSAANPNYLWDLRCYMREKAIEYIIENYPQHLPRIRYIPIFNEKKLH